MKALKTLLFGIGLILAAVWVVLCVLLIPQPALLLIACLILAAGIVFIFIGFLSKEKDDKPARIEETCDVPGGAGEKDDKPSDIEETVHEE